MAIVSLSEAKDHLRVNQTTEDTLIQLYIDAASDYVREYLNGEIKGELDSPVSTPAAIKAAALLLIGDLYENREAGGVDEIKRNPAVGALLYPYRVRLGI